MAYPLSSNVLDGQPTAYQHYNNLRSDALHLGQASTDVVALGGALRDYAANLVVQPLGAVDQVRIPYDGTYPCTLFIPIPATNYGYLLQATANIDLPAGAISGAAAQWYIIAVQNPGSTTFTLEASVSPLPGDHNRRCIATVYWDGAKIIPASLFVYHGRPRVYMATIRRVAAQSVNNTTLTAVSFDTEDVDTDALWAIGTPTVVTIVHPGVYLVIGTGTFTADADGYRYVTFEINGATTGMPATLQSIVAAGSNPEIQAVITHYFNTGDTIELMLYHSAGAATNCYGKLTVAALSA